MIGLATRGVGAIDLLQGLLPGAALDALALLTWLGSVPLAIVLSVLTYWFVSRDRGAFGVGTVLGAFALTLLLKTVFALPRPPASGHLIEASSYGFPSGHAITVTVLWGFLALAIDRGSERGRLGLASVVVGLVAVSRVALGVHYAVDVVAGIAVGGAYLLLLVRAERVDVAFGVAVVLSALAVLATGAGDDAFFLLGGSLAGGLVWTRLSVPASPWREDGLVPAASVGGGIGAVVLVGYRWELAAPLEFAIGAVAVAAAIALPALVARVRG